MTNWMFFPQNSNMPKHLYDIIEVFNKHESLIDSDVFNNENNQESNVVLEILRPNLEKAGYLVEKSKKKEDKIRVPVLFGRNGTVELAFEVDAFSEKNKTVIEVEAGRAVVNYQFLKDYYEACMMQDIKYFVVAVKNIYKNKKDFDKVCDFFKTLYISNKVSTQLDGILVIGY